MPEIVFVCDDNAQIRRLIATVLRPRNYELHEFSNGQTLLDALASVQPHLVVLDLNMPGLSGLEVLERIRADPALAQTRVMLLTGAAEASSETWAEQVGANAHLMKPFAIGELDAAVHLLLSDAT